ncbi:hypothetical protein SNEBB_010618 [Seison nebaliae]|nr:hypothetical protein SNEBB_010618 [Seison nebaliae]
MENNQNEETDIKVITTTKLLPSNTEEIWTYDDILAKIGSFGKFQIFWYLLFTTTYCFNSIMVYDWTFLMAIPDYKCVDNMDTNLSTSKNCLKYNSTETCTNFTFSSQYFQQSLVIRWNMVCDRLWIRNSILTSLFLGFFLGSVCGGIIADKFGRRFGVRLGLMSAVIFWLLTGLTPLLDQFWEIDPVIILYCAFKFGMGFGHFLLLSILLLQISEMTGTNDRAKVNISVPMWWAVGEVVFVIYAYFIRDPVKLNCSMVFLFLPIIILQKYIPESVRWLLVEERFDQAYDMVQRKIRWNKGSSYELRNWDDLVACEKKKLELEFLNKKPNTSLIVTSIKVIFKSKVMIVIDFCCCNLMFSSVMIYFGYAFTSNKLPGNPFKNFLISAILEFFGVFLSYVATLKYDKRSVVITLLIISGVINLMLGIQTLIPLGHWKSMVDIVVIAISMIGKTAIAGTCAVGYFLCLELFPTSVRGICFGTCTFSTRIGAFLAPQIIYLGEKYHPIISFIMFGIFGVVTAISTSYLPPTKNLPLTQTVKETEKLYKIKKTENTIL